ncbi:MAG: hypothetical protein HC890_12680 [Chloroflexaceae bacterium]|nr:hypothetical protein [Chloroflexaceae bacterium]
MTQRPWRDYEVGLRAQWWQGLGGFILASYWLDCQGAADLASWEIKEEAASEDVLLITSGENPSYRDSGIRSLFQLLIQGAKARVWLASPYFLPDENLRESLVRARQRGIDVRILTMGKRCDKPFVRHAAQERYGDLLTSGVIIYEYQPSMLHAKLVLVDEDWVSFGSANFDPRSFFQNEELNITSRDKALITAAASFISESFLWSETMSLKSLRQRSWYQRLMGRLALLFYWQL